MTIPEFLKDVNKGRGNTLPAFSALLSESDYADLLEAKERVARIGFKLPSLEITSILVLPATTVATLRRIQNSADDITVK